MKKIKVCLDSRIIEKGEYFVPVVGENFDGHKFVDEVVKMGAAGVIEVEELYKMAEGRLTEVKPVIVGVAGSVGKSSFRSMLTSILETKFKVLEGDLNTKLGLATLIFNELTDQKVFVAEMGIDRLGEMEEAMKFIRPDFSVVTKIEKEHLQFLLSIENVARENSVAISKSKKGKGYVNEKDVQMLEKWIDKGKMIIFPEENIEENIRKAVSRMQLSKHESDYLLGIYQIVRDNFDFDENEFIESLGNIKRPKGRLNLIEGENGSLIIDDSYNAVSDSSVIKGVEFASEMAKKQNRKLTILLSNMRETGESEVEQHKNVAEYLNSMSGVKIILVGDEKGLYGKYLKNNFKTVKTSEEVRIEPASEDIIYVKGSQFFRMEKIIERIMNRPEDAEKLLVRQDKRWK